MIALQMLLSKQGENFVDIFLEKFFRTTRTKKLESLSTSALKFRSLPLKKLWAWLVSVACTQTGEQRLMATGLLLRVLLVSR
jgi:hypothetical protein